MVQKVLKILVAVLAVLVCGRLVLGPPKPKGLVVMTNLKPYTLKKAAFEVDESTVMVVSATGSADERSGASGLAASAWIISAPDGRAVWDMQHQSLLAGKGALRRVKADTIVLESGQYEAFFSSHGQLLRHGGRKLRRDRDAWQFVLRPAEKNAPARLIDHVRDDAVGSSVVWDATRLRNNEHRDYLFEVVQPTTVKIAATGQVQQDSNDEPNDHSWIENIVSGQRVWSFTSRESEPAGGLPYNRRFSGEVTLADGVYRAVAETDRSHAYSRWLGNPPWAPEAWGLRILAEDQSAIEPFDPWQSRQPIVSIMRVGNDRDITQRFEVAQHVAVVICSMGEVMRHDEFDFARLSREQRDLPEVIWAMDYGNSKHAGGASKNRYAESFLLLDPGMYMLEYESDGSHAWDSWNESEPDFPDRWGVSMFPVINTLPEGVITLVDTSWPSETTERNGDAPKAWPLELPNPPPDAERPRGDGDIAPVQPEISDGEVLIDWRQLGAHEQRAHQFTVQEPIQVGIRALGEIDDNRGYDYGWIQRMGQRQPAWEMTMSNTVPAGGADENRLFVGYVSLDPGEYLIQYVTDLTHHFGDFEDGAPDRPNDWGITVWMSQE
jgi:hypothetical protein